MLLYGLAFCLFKTGKWLFPGSGKNSLDSVPECTVNNRFAGYTQRKGIV